jgi:zinc protease
MKLARALSIPCLAAGLATAGAAMAAPADSSEPEVVNVTTPAGTAARPDLNIRVPNFELKTEMFTFPSGLRVMFQDDDSQPIIAITSVTDHGASDDPLGKEGIAHLVEHLWFRSEHGDLPKVWDIIESELGCDLNAFTQYDITAYMTVCSGRHLEAMMKLESLRITDTVRAVTEDMVTTEIEVVRNEIRMRAENFNIPFFTIWEMTNGHLFDETYPYHRPMAGNHSTIRNCKLKDIQTFTENYYRPDTTTMMVVGSLPSTSPGYLLHLMTTSFDLELLHPDLTEEHLRRMPRENVEQPDPANPDHWYIIPMDPENPDRPLPYLMEMEPRSEQFSELKPPEPVTTELGVYEGPVKDPTVVVAWTMPPGYQGNDTLMQLSGWALSIVVGSGMSRLDDPHMRNFDGCFALPSKRSTSMFCVATMRGQNSKNAERIAGRMVDQVVQLYDPQWRQILDMVFSVARMQFMAQTLRSVDLYAAVGAGRATEIAQHAHFTGDQRYHSAKIAEASKLQSFQVADLAGKWLKRDRAAMLMVKPLERDEVALLSEDTEGSGGHFRGGGEDSILNPSVDPDDLTPDYIRTLFALPDVSKIDDFKLPNGLRVVIMPHTDAPLVKATVIANGGSANDTSGITEYADFVWGYDTNPVIGSADIRPLQIGAEWGSGVGETAQMLTLKSSGGNLDGALWLLRERIESTFPDFTFKRGYFQRQEFVIKARWKDARSQQRQMMWEHLNPGHPIHDTVSWNELKELKKTSVKDLKEHYATTWQPANSTLLIVGNVDPRQARGYAIKYFGGWRAKKGVEPKKIDPVPGYGEKPGKRKIVVFDDEGKTQTSVTLVCPLKPAESEPAPVYDLLGDVSRMTLFAKLREEAGVVYSPYAGAFTFAGGSAYMYMTAAIQNDSAVFALEQYIDYLDRARNGEVKETDIRIKKLGQANGYVLRQQSIDQMSSRLTGAVAQGLSWDAFASYADGLSQADADDFAEIVGDCADHAFISFIGPESKIRQQLDDAGFEYEKIDIEARYEALYAENDPKGFEKYKKEKEKQDEKKASERGCDEGEDCE